MGEVRLYIIYEILRAANGSVCGGGQGRRCLVMPQTYRLYGFNILLGKESANYGLWVKFSCCLYMP